MITALKALSLASFWLALALTVSCASAATISLTPPVADSAQAIVRVEGPLLPGDDSEFWSRVGSLTKAIVSFNSDGGSVLAGIAIGKAIRLKSFGTVVLDGKRCASACALAWLGGTPRFMGSSALVGFMLPMFSAKDRLQKLAWGTLWLDPI